MSRLRSNKVVNQAGSGAPELTYGAVIPNTGTISGAGGVNLTGIITATTFSGPISGDVTGNVTGNLTGDVTGNLTGNVTGNTSGSAGSLAAGATGSDLTLSGNLTVNGTTTTIDTVVTSVDRLEVDGGLSVGAGVNAVGIITAAQFIKSDGTPVAGDSDITSCLFV